MSFTSVFIITYIFFSIVLLASNLQRVYTVKKKKKWTDNNKENPELANSHIYLTTTLCFSFQEHSILKYIMNLEQFYKILVSVLQDYLKEIFQLLGQSAVISMKSHTQC